MLDMSNYSKTAIKINKSQRSLRPELTSVQEQNGFVWLQHGLSSKEAPGSLSKLMANHPVRVDSTSFLPGDEEWGMSGEWLTPHLWQPGRGWISSLPSHWAHRSWGLWLAQLLWGGIKPILRNPESWISTQYCVIRETDTASQCETDPAPDELGE